MYNLDLLLVEDNPHDAFMVKRALQKEELVGNVHWLQDGETAVDYLMKDDSPQPHLVLLDIKLPKLDGIGVLKKLKQYRATHVLPIVMFTSSSEISDIQVAYEMGANSYLIKPSTYHELSDILSLIVKYWIQLNKIP